MDLCTSKKRNMMLIPKSKCMGWKFTDRYVTFCAKSVIAKTNSGHPRLLIGFGECPHPLPPPPQNPPSPPLSAPPEQTALSDSFTSRLPLHLYLSCSSICLHLYSHFILGIKCLFPLYPRHKMLPESRPPLHLAFVFSDCTFLIDSFFYGLSSI